MNILHIADFGITGNFNGVGAAVLNLAKQQKILGQNAVILSTRPNSSIDIESVAVTSSKEFYNTLDNLNPDIVIFHSFYDFIHPRFAKILLQKNIPYLITFHGGASKDNYKRKHFVKWLVNNLIFKKYIKKAASVIYLNEGEKQNSIFLSLTKNKSLILPNGIVFPENKHVFNTHSRIIISFISRLDYQGKGLDVLLLAIDSIAEKLRAQNVQFRFYGYHYNDGTVEKIQNLSPLCEYYGFVQGNEKNRAYLDTDILILPSRSEGMPMCILEALSYGIPSIVTPQTNVADIISANNCGWVTDLNVDKLAKTILVAIDDIKSHSTEIRNNCVSISHKYGWDSIAANSILQYQKILEGHYNIPN